MSHVNRQSSHHCPHMWLMGIWIVPSFALAGFGCVWLDAVAGERPPAQPCHGALSHTPSFPEPLLLLSLDGSLPASPAGSAGVLPPLNPEKGTWVWSIVRRAYWIPCLPGQVYGWDGNLTFFLFPQGRLPQSLHLGRESDWVE